MQGTKNLNTNEIKSILNDHSVKQADKNTQLLAGEQERNKQLQKELDFYRTPEMQAHSVSTEMAALFPEAASVSISRTVSYTVDDNMKKDSLTLVCLTLKRKMSAQNREKLEEWLKARLKTDNMKLIVGTNTENTGK